MCFRAPPTPLWHHREGHSVPSRAVPSWPPSQGLATHSPRCGHLESSVERRPSPPPLGTSLHFPPSPPGTPPITLAPVTLLLKGGPRCVEGWLAGDSTILLNGDTSHGLCWEAAGTLAS